MEGEKNEYDIQKELTLLAQYILNCNTDGMNEALERNASYLRRLELTVRKLYKQNKELEVALVDSQKMCKQHYDNCQKVIRHELKLDPTVRRVEGKILDSGEKFTL